MAPAIRELDPELAERAKKDLGEDPARRQEDIDHIKSWLAKQSFLNANTGTRDKQLDKC